MLSKTRRPLAVTGIGVYSPLGKDPTEFWQAIELGQCAVSEIQSFCTQDLRVRHAAEIVAHDPAIHFKSQEEQELDWTSQFGIIAARQALCNSGVSHELVQSARLGLVVGVCAGGQGKKSEANPFDIDLASFPENSLYRQTDNIGKALSLHGPRTTVSTACASSGSALGYAFDLLQLEEVDAVLVGGTDAFSISTYAGFYALGAMPEQPISPFSENTGVSFGEGAGFVVLERLDTAESRKATVHGLLLGHGSSGDAHHVTAPHPGGEGLQRAMQAAVERSGISLNRIGYINAHGTATRDNDRAESSAIRELFQGRDNAPPVSSSKSQFGHTLGAAGILEFITSILAQKAGKLPPTVNFKSARPGCDLDYVPNESRDAKFEAFLSNSAAFGGINVSVLGGAAELHEHSFEQECDEIWITGTGVVSPIGSGAKAFRDALWNGDSGIALINEFETESCTTHHASLMRDFKPRKLAPTIDTRRTDPLNRYAMVAAYLALQDAKLSIRPTNENQVGMVMSLSYGSLAVQERFQDSLLRDGLEKLSAKHFPSMVVSTVGGTVSQAFGLKGVNATIADGVSGGLSGLVYAANTLRRASDQEAIVLVGADEVAPFLFKAFDQRKLLAPSDKACTQHNLGAYRSDSKGWILGEGGVSLVLERASAARKRGAKPIAKIASTASGSDALVVPESHPTPEHAIGTLRRALAAANLRPEEIDVVYGHGRGQLSHDKQEITALESVFGESKTPLACLLGNIGVASASCGLFSIAGALSSIQRGELYPVVGPQADLPSAMQLVTQATNQDVTSVVVAGSTESCNHNAVVLTRVGEL